MVNHIMVTRVLSLDQIYEPYHPGVDVIGLVDNVENVRFDTLC
jgi:hypothetical protein